MIARFARNKPIKCQVRDGRDAPSFERSSFVISCQETGARWLPSLPLYILAELIWQLTLAFVYNGPVCTLALLQPIPQAGLWNRTRTSLTLTSTTFTN